MTRVFVAAVTALFLGAVITEIHSRLFAGQYFPMLVLAVLAIFVGALVTTRIASRGDTGPTAAAEIVADEGAVGVASAPVEQFVAAQDDGGARRPRRHQALLPGMRITPRAFMK